MNSIIHEQAGGITSIQTEWPNNEHRIICRTSSLTNLIDGMDFAFFYRQASLSVSFTTKHSIKKDSHHAIRTA